ncbi:hypothetical protein ACTWQB_13395 [Piscibacillus sp. B03]|uniref:hypothetical protein n=1 Tax=Piscibacillus sp. B03 TaxID=3457430 RepID=UPI003FCE1D0E
MRITKWSVYQIIILLLLVVLAFLAERFNQGIAIQPSQNEQFTIISMVIIVTFTMTVIFFSSSFYYFQAKKSNTFLRHSLWNKMPLIIPVVFSVLIIVMLALYMMTSLQDQRWFMYVIIYFSLFAANLFVLSIVNKVNESSSLLLKIKYSGAATALFILVVLFVV